MRYHNITKDDMLNGDGLRVVLWVSGCTHACPECHNPVTWDINGGLPFDEAAKKELFAELAKPYVSGVTLSGGDPLIPQNVDDVSALIDEIKEKFPQKNHLGVHRVRVERRQGFAAHEKCGRAGGRTVCQSAQRHQTLLARQFKPEGYRGKEKYRGGRHRAALRLICKR